MLRPEPLQTLNWLDTTIQVSLGTLVLIVLYSMLVRYYVESLLLWYYLCYTYWSRLAWSISNTCLSRFFNVLALVICHFITHEMAWLIPKWKKSHEMAISLFFSQRKRCGFYSLCGRGGTLPKQLYLKWENQAIVWWCLLILFWPWLAFDTEPHTATPIPSYCSVGTRYGTKWQGVLSVSTIQDNKLI